MSQLEIEDQVQTDLQRATGLAETGSESASRLNRVLQLTGMPQAAGLLPNQFTGTCMLTTCLNAVCLAVLSFLGSSEFSRS